jgi:aminoglycoside phosphotransferase (APT) family kinase protein
VVANFEAGHPRAECDDFARSFVPTDQRQRNWHRAIVGVFVGVAHASCQGLDQDLAFLGIRDLDLFNAPVGTNLAKHRSSALHDDPFSQCVRISATDTENVPAKRNEQQSNRPRCPFGDLNGFVHRVSNRYRAGMAEDITVVKTSRQPEDLRRLLQAWIQETTGDQAATVGPVSSPDANGMSSESLFFDASWDGRAASLVARLAPSPDDVPAFMTYDLKRQYDLIELVGRRSSVPVPELVWLETDPTSLGVPFFIMHRVKGRVPSDLPPYSIDGWVRDLTPDARAQLVTNSLSVLAGVHSIDIADGSADFLEFDSSLGDTPLRRHFADQQLYYRWMCDGAGRSFPAIERAFAWIEANWPDEQPSAISWGDSRIGNIMYEPHGVAPVAVLDWEMAAIAPPALDVGWMCFMHRFFEYLLGLGGMDTLPDMLQPAQARETYGEMTGVDVGDLRFELAYSATRHAIIMSRLHARNVHFGTHEWPEEADDAFLFKGLLAELTAD